MNKSTKRGSANSYLTHTKNQKGITLIALIITIIVMLILVGVTVSVALNGGLFETAKKAVEGTKTALKSEQDILSMGTWIKSGTTLKNVATGDTIQIGAKVNYEEGTVPTSGMEWRVLGVNDKGEVELISTKPTNETVELYGKEGYLNAITILDTACTPYGQGEGASGARALTAEDINKLAGYDPATKYTGYGTKYTYKYANGWVYGIVSASITDANKDNITGWSKTDPDEIGSGEFITPDWTLNSTNVGPKELEDTNYSYQVSTILKEKTPDGDDWSSVITGENPLYYDSFNRERQFLATRAVLASDTGASFCIGSLYEGVLWFADYLLNSDTVTERV